MEYKWVKVSDGISIPVPIGMTPEDEANFIANKIAFMDFAKLEAEGVEALKLLKEGKLIPMRSVIEELENAMKTSPGANA